jgi:TPP-dependent pyruvate/acetoin dehydrogenase alpha subunit
MGMRLERAEAEPDIHKKAEGYRIPSEVVDGMDVVAVEAAARRAAELIRADKGPYFLECRTYRLRAHSMFDAQLYRPKDEIEAWKQKGPIVRFQGWLEEAGLLHADDVTSIEAEIATEVAAAVAFAEAGTLEAVEELERFVLMDEVPA